MLADAGAGAVVTRSSLSERIAPFTGAVVRLDADADAIAAAPEDAPGIAVHPENLAYVIYTSGSTGAPKGVLIEHRGLANYLAWFERTVLGEGGFALPLVSRLSFDAHVRQLFPPLLRDSQWGTRMRGEGVFADQYEALFGAACRKHGLVRHFPALSADAFRRPHDRAGQMGLFG